MSNKAEQEQDPYAGMTLMQKAAAIMEKSFDAKYIEHNKAKSNSLLEEAAKVYDEAGLPKEAEVCRLLIEG